MSQLWALAESSWYSRHQYANCSTCCISIGVKLCLLSISNSAVDIYISYCCFIDRPALPQGITNLVWISSKCQNDDISCPPLDPTFGGIGQCKFVCIANGYQHENAILIIGDSVISKL